MINKNDLVTVVKAASKAGFKNSAKNLELLVWGKGMQTHKPASLRKGSFAVYIFELNGIFLKVGKVCGEKNNDRYRSHHYIIKGANSTLAKSLSKHSNYSKIIGKEKIRDWMLTNINRYNILIPQSYGKHFVNFVEAFFILKCNPLFEGRASKINPI